MENIHHLREVSSHENCNRRKAKAIRNLPVLFIKLSLIMHQVVIVAIANEKRSSMGYGIRDAVKRLKIVHKQKCTTTMFHGRKRQRELKS